MLDLEYKQSLQIISMLTEAGRDKEALKMARETFRKFKVIDSELIFLLYKLNLRQGDTREAFDVFGIFRQRRVPRRI